MVYVNCDGSITGGNPGGRGYTGWVVKDEAGQVIHKHSDDLGRHPKMTNNVAEYGAVLSAILWLRKTGRTADKVMIISDSQLVIRQLQGAWECSSRTLDVLRMRILLEAAHFPSVAYLWVPREQNTEADIMSKSLQ